MEKLRDLRLVLNLSVRVIRYICYYEKHGAGKYNSSVNSVTSILQKARGMASFVWNCSSERDRGINEIDSKGSYF